MQWESTLDDLVQVDVGHLHSISSGLRVVFKQYKKVILQL